MFIILIILSLYYPNLSFCGQFLIKTETLNGVVTAYAFKDAAERDNGNDLPACALQYNNSYQDLGWDTLEIQTNPINQTDESQAKCAGELEGFVTYNATYIHFYNNVRQWCKGRKETCSKVYSFLNEHLDWVVKKITKEADKDPIWHHVKIFYYHVIGLQAGYDEGQTDPRKKLTQADFILMNLQVDLDDVADALEGNIGTKQKGDSRCSAIVKLLPKNEDLLIGHNTWTSYSQMYRMLKKYIMPLHISPKSNVTVPGQVLSFSGYPSVITSMDDFIVTSAHLVALETTIGNSNASRWQYVSATGQIFETVRSLIALRLANDGNSWCKTFANYNSGTYNNQWMIVDLNKFHKGKQPDKGTLWILEQIPGYIRYEDQTALLVAQGYWPSYNTPFYRDVFNLSGNQELVDKYGDWFSYNNTPRALIFKRDQSLVTDLNSLLSLLRSNNFKNDPLAKCNCTPPYSAENAIAARSDLNPKNGKYPFPALGHRPHGAIDAKVISPLLAQNLTFLAVCGPTTGTKLPPFRWDKSDYRHLPHLGQPNSFNQFHPFLPLWRGPFF